MAALGPARREWQLTVARLRSGKLSLRKSQIELGQVVREAVDEADLVHAGTGGDRGAARAARYLETGKGRVGLVSMASTFPEFAEALAPRGGAPGRPGLNALKTKRVTIVPAATMRDLARLAGILGPAKDCPAPDAVPSETPDPRAADKS